MVTRLLFFLAIISSLLFAACECRDDEFGENMELIIPFNSFPSKDTFLIGDTIWIEAKIDKNVEVREVSSTIYLDSFNFFTELVLSEISDTMENFDVDIEIVEEIGAVEQLSLSTALVYPITYEEDGQFYRAKAGIVLRDTGLFFLAFNTTGDLYEFYEHPAVYSCNNDRRNKIRVHYKNSSTSLATYEDLFLSTNVAYIPEVYHFQRYSDVGAHTFIVRDP